MASRRRVSADWARAWASRSSVTSRATPMNPREAALRALAEALAAGVDPDRPAARQARHPERDVEAAVDRRRAQRLAQAVAMALGDALQHLLTVDHPAAPAEQGGGDIGHEDLVGRQVPLPDAATRRLDGQAEALLAVGEGRVRPLDPPRLQQQEDAQCEGDAHRRQQPEELFARRLRPGHEAYDGDGGVEGEQRERRQGPRRGRTPGSAQARAQGPPTVPPGTSSRSRPRVHPRLAPPPSETWVSLNRDYPLRG